MAVCEKLEGCPFYRGKLVIETNIGETLKEKYCMNDKESCARYMVFKNCGPEYVNDTLFPHMKDKAIYLIGEYKSKNER